MRQGIRSFLGLETPLTFEEDFYSIGAKDPSPLVMREGKLISKDEANADQEWRVGMAFVFGVTTGLGAALAILLLTILPVR